jgi:hypothetical protein
VVPAVDDDRLALVQRCRRFRIKRLEWDIDRSGQMLLCVLFSRQYFDELGSVGP